MGKKSITMEAGVGIREVLEAASQTPEGQKAYWRTITQSIIAGDQKAITEDRTGRYINGWPRVELTNQQKRLAKDLAEATLADVVGEGEGQVDGNVLAADNLYTYGWKEPATE